MHIVLVCALAVVVWVAVLVAADGLDRLTGWFGDHGPMYTGNRKHRRHLARLAREATADWEHCSALNALTRDDRVWLKEAGWVEPRHAAFVRLNDWQPARS